MRAATSAPCTDLNYVATTEYSDYIYMPDAHGAIASTPKYNAQADVRTGARRIPTLRATQSSEGAATGVTARLIGGIIAVAGGYPIRLDTQLCDTDGWASGKGPTAARPIGPHALAATVPRVSHAPAFRACFQAPPCLPRSSTLRVRSNETLCCTSLAARSQPPWWSRMLCTHPTFLQGRGRQVTPVSPPDWSALDPAGFPPPGGLAVVRRPPGTVRTGAPMPTTRTSGCLASVGNNLDDTGTVSALSPNPNAFRHPAHPPPPPQHTRTPRLHPDYSRRETMRTRRASP
jgi:hypothetical protein